MHIAKRQILRTRNHGRTLTVSEQHFSTWDGSRLFYRCWHPGAADGRALILFHGGHEHSARFQELVQDLNLQGFSVFAWDARGHGRSPGPRGHARHFHDFVRDADCFLRHIASHHGIAYANMVLLGHSVGSVIISTWLQDYARGVRGVVLGSPAFRVKLYVPLALTALRLWQRLRPNACVSSYVKPQFLTHDEDEIESRLQDPLISPQIAVRVLTSLFDTANRVIRNAAAITTPVLLISAGSDWVVKRSAQERFFRRLGSRRKALHLCPGFYHEVFHEQQRHQVIGQVGEFIRSLFAETANPPAGAGIPPELRLPRPGLPEVHWLRRLGYRATRLALKSFGRLSNGIRLGWQVGFDAGRMLDHVYENRSGGISIVGKLIDRIYLNTIGWRRIRDRRAHLRTLLLETVRRVRAERPGCRIVDIASGPGRTLLDILAELKDPAISALCRDIEEDELACGRQGARERGIPGIQFERRDAFDPNSYIDLQTPDVVLASGLYELFSDNAAVLRSLRCIHRALAAGGTLIYTNQPTHPQLQFIAHVLDDRNRQPWVMRPRSQDEMRRLLAQAGFEVQELLIDDDGIFAAGSARKGTAR